LPSRLRCASCHIFADFDSLAWNLGDPDAEVSDNTQPGATPLLPTESTFHPMKGPMTTQTLRGLATHGGMHWRGDRVDGFFGTDPCTEPTGAPCDEDLSFNDFIVAFEGLLGKDGEDLFFGPVTDVVANCNGCHGTDPAQGFVGSGGEQSFEGEPQDFKIAHMRNLYAKIGMFNGGGDAVRGFGFLHDGTVDTVASFLAAPVFNRNATEEAELEQFSLAFPSDVAPVVGQQVTLSGAGSADVNGRIDLLIQRAGTSFDSLVLGACGNGIDDDGDGPIDAADPGCAVGLTPHVENPQCDDGYDDDNDGAADLADDRCTTASVGREAPKSGCGLTGAEALAALVLLGGLRRRRR